MCLLFSTAVKSYILLSENDRERMKQILDQEKASHSRKERELARKLKENKVLKHTKYYFDSTFLKVGLPTSS